MKVLKSLPEKSRHRYRVRGAVQGVGFRPFVYRLAHERGLSGWVQNTPDGVIIEVEGATQALTRFREGLQKEKPPHAVIDRIDQEVIAPDGGHGFEIVASAESDTVTASILPDLAVCADCLHELGDPADRRYRYPFINCTHCGPRYTIINSLPYDRPATTMAGFTLCLACRKEYEDPRDRRFHAQPVACPDCGPQLELWDPVGNMISRKGDALSHAAECVRAGQILALKGLGGFHLVVDAQNEEAVQKLRLRKRRPSKPFALMYPSLSGLQKDCHVGELEAELLLSAAAPIVLLEKRRECAVAPAAAPGNPYLGVMLPATPLHVLLLQELGFPVIATSGNRPHAPVCIDEIEALDCLCGIADAFLVHNRPIARRADDSIVRVMAGQATVLRRARGYAPMPFLLAAEFKNPVLAAGGHLKNTVALGVSDRLVLGPHIGDLDAPEALAAHEQTLKDLGGLYRKAPEVIMCDAHPGYISTLLAQDSGLETVLVQHHYAHALSCMLDNDLEAPCLAVVWDGAGLGDDGTFWGGEFLEITPAGYARLFHLRKFPLPGGDAAARDPQRAALGILYALNKSGEGVCIDKKESILQMLKKNLNCPMTSSAGRLFDAVAALTNVCRKNTFEGEAAMALEFTAGCADRKYPYTVEGDVLDWGQMIEMILSDLTNNTPVAEISGRFHATLADMIVQGAQKSGHQKVLLTGGCFQNKLLLETTVENLHRAGFQPYWHHRLPPNDGGLAAGQIMAATRRI